MIPHNTSPYFKASFFYFKHLLSKVTAMINDERCNQFNSKAKDKKW